METTQPNEIIFYKFTNDILKHVLKNVKFCLTSLCKYMSDFSF
jgi:hypothetical protein